MGDRPRTKTSDNLLTDSDIQTFKQTFRGLVVTPEDAGYDEARTVYNRMIDRRPRFIARCRNVADVMSAVNFAREHRLPPAIRGGGHNVAGFGVCDDGIVIDMSLMKGIRVDPEQQTVRGEAGCTWGDLRAPSTRWCRKDCCTTGRPTSSTSSPTTSSTPTCSSGR